jgi:hypothetical protein
VVLADADEPAAQRCFDRWRGLGSAERARGPAWSALGAVARWGTVSDLESWLAITREPPMDEVKTGAQLLRARGRDDLAWIWLVHRLPAPRMETVPAVDPGLPARVLANPSDFVSAARLVAQTRDPGERLKLLERIAARPGAPAAFLVQSAHALRENGRRAEALDRLQAAAGMAAASP